MILANTFLSLRGFWFVVIGVLWAGYLVLEGFDFGVGMLLRLIGRDDAERKAVIGTIEPVWDGNEVWLIVAGGATFAAFPNWYATLFSGYYIVFFLILIALIFRGVAIEYRAKRPEQRWRSVWETAIVLGSVVPAFLWGLTFANIIHGVPIDAHGEFSGGLGDLFGGYAILGGFTSLAIFGFHGARVGARGMVARPGVDGDAQTLARGMQPGAEQARARRRDRAVDHRQKTAAPLPRQRFGQFEIAPRGRVDRHESARGLAQQRLQRRKLALLRQLEISDQRARRR